MRKKVKKDIGTNVYENEVEKKKAVNKKKAVKKNMAVKKKKSATKRIAHTGGGFVASDEPAVTLLLRNDSVALSYTVAMPSPAPLYAQLHTPSSLSQSYASQAYTSNHTFSANTSLSPKQKELQRIYDEEIALAHEMQQERDRLHNEIVREVLDSSSIDENGAGDGMSNYTHGPASLFYVLIGAFMVMLMVLWVLAYIRW